MYVFSDDLACLESASLQADFALRIMRLRMKKIPQVILVLIGRHWLCFGLRYEGSDIVLSSYNSAGHLDSITDWHRKCYDLFHIKVPETLRDVIQELAMNLKKLSIGS